MKNLFYMGGPEFMAAVTILFIITTAWIIYHFVVGYTLKEPDLEKSLRKIGYGKTLGLFTLVIGILGQMLGLFGMFSAIEEATGLGKEIDPTLVFGGLKVTMIVPIYGVLVYLFALLLCFAGKLILEKRIASQAETN